MEASCDASIPGVPPIKTLLLVSLLAVAVGLPFLPALSNDFVNFDDPAYITENELIRLPPLEAARRAVTSFDQTNWHPLTLLSHALDMRLFGLNPAGHHAHSLLLHVGTVALLFAWLRLMGVTPAGAWWGALLFGVHPLRVESVAWAAERKDVLCAFLFLAALVSFARHRAPAGSRLWYPLALVCHALALMAKPMAVTFPVVVLLIDRHRRHPFTRRTVAETAPFFLLSAGAGFLILIAQQPALRIGSTETPLWDGPFIAAHGLLRYLAATLLPVRLSPVYPYPERVAGLLPWPYLLAMPAVLALSALLWRQRRIRPLLFTGGALFLVMLAPVLQLVPVGFIGAADRYTYLPSVGFAWPLARGIGLALRRFTGKARAALAVVLALAAVAYGAGTAGYVSVWRDSLTLWDRVTGLYPRSFMAWYFRGATLHNLGRWDEAMTDYQRALDLTSPFSRTVMIHHNMGNLFLSRGRLDEALDSYRKAMIEEDWPESIEGYGRTLLRAGRAREALVYLERALAKRPGHRPALITYIQALGEAGQPEEAAILREQLHPPH